MMIAFDWVECGFEDTDTGYQYEWKEYYLYINIFPGVIYKIQSEYYEELFDYTRHSIKIKSNWLYYRTEFKLFNKYL